MSVEDVYKRLDEKITLNLAGKKPKEVYERLDKMNSHIIDSMKKNKWDEAYLMCRRWIICVEWLKKQKFIEKDVPQKYYSMKKQNDIKRLFKEIKIKIEGDFLTRQRKLLNENNPNSNNSSTQTNDEVDLELQLPDVPTEEPQPKNLNEISCSELYSIMHNDEIREKGVLIIDLRDSEDFAAGKMAFQDYMINIPESKIWPKKTANYYQLALADNDAAVKRFQKRGDAHIIVLVDWDCHPNKLDSPIAIFKKFLEEDKATRDNRSAILLGGFDEWVRCYPKLVVRPEAKRPEVTNMDQQNEIKKQIENNFGFDFPSSPNPHNANTPSPVSTMRTGVGKALPFSSPNPQVMGNNVINSPILPQNYSIFNDILPNSSLNSTLNSSNQIKNNTMNTYNNNASLSMYNNRMSDKPMIPFTSPNQIIIPTPAVNPSVMLSDISNYNETSLPTPASVPTPTTSHVFYPPLNGTTRMREPKVLIEKLTISKPTVDRSNKPVPGRKLSSDNSQIVQIEKELANTRSILVQYDRTLERNGRLDDWTKEQYDTLRKKEEELTRELEKVKSQGPSAPKNGKLYPDLTNNLSGLALNNKPRTTSRSAKPDTRNEDKENIHQPNPQVKIERMRIDPPIPPLIQRPPPQQTQRMDVDEPPSSESYREPLKCEPTTPNPGLKRSHSSPNLQKVKKHKARHQIMGGQRKSLIPQVDRSSKPHLAPENNIRMPVLSSKDREERFEPVYGNNTHPGITGLKNLGNSCYMNSIIQCLSNTSILAHYFNDGDYAVDLNKKNDKNSTGYVAEEVAQVIKALWRGQYKSISPRDLKVVVGQYKFQFESYDQQDSHEFLMFLLDWMHNDLRQKSKVSYNRELTVAEKEWDKSLEGQTSIVSRTFFGQLRSTIECTTCLQKSTTYETFNSLTMSLPTQNKCTLDDCVKKFVSGQKVSGWKCPNCKAPRDGVKKFDLAKLPHTIIIHLNRFGDSGGWGFEKKNTAVDFPLTGFDLKQYVVSDAENNAPSSVYNLYAMSNHYGTMDGGHYTAYCKSSTQKKWYKYDDHTVSEVPQSQVKGQSTSAYLLFYASVPAEKMIMHS